MDHQSDMTWKRSFLFSKKLLCNYVMRHNRKSEYREAMMYFKPLCQPPCFSVPLQSQWRPLRKGGGYTDVFREWKQKVMRTTGESLKTPVWKYKRWRKEDTRSCIFLYLDQRLPESFSDTTMKFFSQEKREVIKGSLNNGGPWACSCKKKRIFFLPCCQHKQ